MRGIAAFRSTRSRLRRSQGVALATLVLGALAAPPSLNPVDAAHGGPAAQEIPGNPTCSGVIDDPAMREFKVQPVEDGTRTDGTLEVTVDVTDTGGGPTFDWESNIGVDGVVVKGGPGANFYEYDPSAIEDHDLHAPVNQRNGKFYGLSHLSFCYVPAPFSTLAKAVRNVTDGELFANGGPTETTADPGEQIQYRLNYENTGIGTATNVTITEEVPGRSTFVECSDNCAVADTDNSGTAGDPGDVITWASGNVAAGDSRAVTFDTQLDATFPVGEIVIPNVATATTDQEGSKDSNEAKVTVTAAPNLTLQKAASEITFGLDDEITYTLTFGNTGNAAAGSTVITEEIPGNTEFSSCTDEDGHAGDCTVADTDGDGVDGNAGDAVTWDLGTVDPSETGSVTLTVTVVAEHGCQICNQAQIASPDQDGGEAVNSNQVCVEVVPQSDPGTATASGEATGLRVVVDALDLDETISMAESSQTGVGTEGDGDEFEAVDVPGVVSATLLGTSSRSDVEADSAGARQVSTAALAEVCVLPDPVTGACTVSADLVKAVAEANADGAGASFNATASTIENLKVMGVEEDVTPDTHIDLPAALFGADSYVAVFEREGSTSTPAPGQLSGGTYAADLTVTMIHVHVTDFATLGAVDLELAQALAQVDFPQTLLCAAGPTQVVSGSALILGETTNPSVAPAKAGAVGIPADGGHDHANVEDASVPSVVSNGTAVSDSEGVLEADESRASSYAFIEEVCILPTGTGCTIRATLVRSQSNSTADADGALSHDTGTTLLGLEIAGAPAPFPVEFTPAPNTAIDVPGVGTVILNEQFCDNGATLASGCSDGTEAGHAGLTVRAIHVILDRLPIGAEITVAEAHSDAGFVAPPSD